jgi:soluble lytic murein transglycosylase-like protein
MKKYIFDVIKDIYNRVKLKVKDVQYMFNVLMVIIFVLFITIMINNTNKHIARLENTTVQKINDMKLSMNNNALQIMGVKHIIDSTINIDTELSFNYAEKIVNTANRYNTVSVSLLVSLIFHESRFKAHIVSSSGAGGLGQLMPETVNMVCEKWNMNCTDSTVFDYVFNIRATAWYLDWLYKNPSICRGDIERTIAYYNGGGRQAYRWSIYRKYTNGVTLDSLETYYMNILAVETKNYVHNVVHNDSLFKKHINNTLPLG